MSRDNLVTKKITTVFGAVFVHLEHNDKGELTGAYLSHAKKVPDAMISIFLEQLSRGIHDALKGHPLVK